MSEKFLTDLTDGYLTPGAKRLVNILVAEGMDKDLAVSTVEAILSEEKAYELDE
jgi:hypothetical protein